MDTVFDAWNLYKKKLELKTTKPFFHEREIWFCSIGKNIGYEEDGKHLLFERPVVVILKCNLSLFIAVPLTSSLKDNQFYFKYTHNAVIYSAIISQIRLLDAKRLSRKIGVIGKDDFNHLKMAIIKLF